MGASKMITETFLSSSLQGNFLNDPAERTLLIYTPEDYYDTDDPYPVVYYLPGYASRGASLMNQIPWGETIQEQLDRLIRTGTIDPMLMVLPDCFTRLGGSQYFNSTGTGKYEDYIVEIVHHIDNTFRTRTDSGSRAIAGKSSGGFGALHLGMNRPDLFGLVVDHSGDKYFEACYYPDFLKLPNLLGAHDIQAIVQDPISYTKKNSGFFDLINLAAMSACYSPNPGSPLGFDWPVDPYTGELQQEVWQLWKSYDPLSTIHEMKENLKSLRFLYFDCGNRDEYNLHLGSRLLHKILEEAGINHKYDEFDGGHRHTRFRMDTFLAEISRAFRE